MGGQGPETRRLYVKGDKVMESLTTQWRHIACAWCIAIKYHGHLQTKNKLTAVRLHPVAAAPPASSLERKHRSNEQQKAFVLRAAWTKSEKTPNERFLGFFCALQEGAFW